jgi:hypothetical protein
MLKRGILKEGQAVPTGIDLALLIMKNYIVYPIEKNDAVLPFNYCMLPKVVPTYLSGPLKSLLSIIC